MFKASEILIYTDDLRSYTTVTVDELNVAFEQINTNKLELNILKTHCMELGSNYAVKPNL